MAIFDKQAAKAGAMMLNAILKTAIKKWKDKGAPEFSIMITPDIETEQFIGYVYTKNTTTGKMERSMKKTAADLLLFLSENSQ